jgi:hypothetical protein
MRTALDLNAISSRMCDPLDLRPQKHPGRLAKRAARIKDLCHKYGMDGRVPASVIDDNEHITALEIDKTAKLAAQQLAQEEAETARQVQEMQAAHEAKMERLRVEMERELEQVLRAGQAKRAQIQSELDAKVRLKQDIIRAQEPAKKSRRKDLDAALETARAQVVEPSPEEPATPKRPVRQARRESKPIVLGSPEKPAKKARSGGTSGLNALLPMTSINPQGEFTHWVVEAHAVKSLVEFLVDASTSRDDFPRTKLVYPGMCSYPGSMMHRPGVKTRTKHGSAIKSPLFLSWEHPVSKVRKMFYVEGYLPGSAELEWNAMGQPRFNLSWIHGLAEAVACIDKTKKPDLSTINFFGSVYAQENCSVSVWAQHKHEFFMNTAEKRSRSKEEE